MGVPSCLNKYQNIILDDMREFLADREQYSHIKMIYYHLGWLDKDFKSIKNSSGKLSRPSLLLHVAETLGCSYNKALPAATAIQLFHDFSLMHDDIEDGDELRRHRETVWKVWGIPRAINAGDAMYSLNFESILRLDDKKNEVMKYLLSVYQKIVYGQELDLSSAELEIEAVSVDKYLQTVSGKSAELIGASAKTGAIIAGATEDVQNHFFDFGFNLGVAYQVFDDIVSFWGKVADSGKNECRDIIEKKKTLPILIGYELANNADKRVLHSVYGKDDISEADIEIVLTILNKYQTKEKCLARLNDFKEIATRSLKAIELSPAKHSEFTEIANWLIPEKI